MTRTTTMVLMLFLLLPIGASFAEAPVYEAKELFQQATLVCVAHVESAGKDWLPPWRTVATATVLDIWKGEKQKTVKFRASPSWQCDTSSAEVGEVVVLMLAPDNGRYLQIVNSGQGKYPVSSGNIDLSGWEIGVTADAASGNSRLKMSLQEFRQLVSR